MWPHSKAESGDGKGGARIPVEAFPHQGVLTEYGWAAGGVVIQPMQPGFSSARVWKLDVKPQAYALRQWPAGHPVHLPLVQIHKLMQEAVDAGLTMVPRVMAARSGPSFVSHQGSVWDVTTWQPGEADTCPDEERLAAAMQVLARLHAAWRRAKPVRKAVCTAVQLQFERLSEWTEQKLLRVESQPGLELIYRQALSQFKAHQASAMQQLQSWLHRQVAVQPCLADIWSDHVLFTGSTVTGIIDYGGMRLDHPAQDIARLLGSYVRGNAVRRSQALAAYQPMTQETEKLVVTLDECGVVVGLGNWLRWMVLEGRSFDRGRVHERMQVLMKRLCQSHGAVHPFV